MTWIDWVIKAALALLLLSAAAVAVAIAVGAVRVIMETVRDKLEELAADRDDREGWR